VGRTRPGSRTAVAVSMEPTGSLAQLLAWRVAERPGYPCLWVEDKGPWSVGQLAAAAVVTADALDAAGVGARTRVIVRIGNDERFLAALVAVWLRRGVAVAMHPAAPAAQVDRVVATLGAAAVIADPSDVVHRSVAVPVVDLAGIAVDAPAATELAAVART
jgi:acyl-CoA synthetase (AMP-forming)/AMP-acid ligase II